MRAMLFASASLGAVIGAEIEARAQPPRIRAVDGDTVLINGEARVNIIRARSAHVRTVFNAGERWLIVLARFTDRRQLSAGVDEAFLFRETDGPWPLGGRWEGDAVIETYVAAGESTGPAGFGLRVPAGLVQLFTKDSQRFASADVAAVMSYRGSERSPANGAPFDAVESARIAQATSGRSGAGVSAGVTLDITPAVGTIPNPPTVQLRKIHDVPPVWPEAARQANVRGLVIVELTIGTDGTVTDANILRGIPLLNGAALECVRQWRYEPVLLDGRAIPMHITATVAFP